MRVTTFCVMKMLMIMKDDVKEEVNDALGISSVAGIFDYGVISGEVNGSLCACLGTSCFVMLIYRQICHIVFFLAISNFYC